MKIEVTAEDIANGEPDNCECCPIALAIKRIVPDLKWVEVDGDAQWATPEGDFGVRFPESAKDFVERFDRGDPVEAFVFECEPRIKQYFRDEDD